VNVLLIVGGHAFEREPFLDLFRAFADVTVVEYPEAEAVFGQGASDAFDAFVFFDHNRRMGPDARRDLVARLRGGQGCLFLHHAIYNHPDWPEFKRILGGFWNASEFTVDGERYGPSQYAYDQEIRVRVVDGDHPVTRGVADFDLVAETYRDFYVSGAVQPLLTTDHPSADRVLGWAHRYERARIVYLQPGHAPDVYGNASYRRLVEQAVRWVAERS
jgi:type 1 glutamine amidotransferase